MGARVGGLGNMPGWWFTVESTTTKHLLKQFKSAIRAALLSKPNVRAKMRARSAMQRFPVAHWKELLSTMHETAIKVNQKRAIKMGLELRGDYNSSLPSSALPSSNPSIALSSQQPLSNDPVESQDEDSSDPPSDNLPSCEKDLPTGQSRKLSLGVRTGPGCAPDSRPRIKPGLFRESFSVGKVDQNRQLDSTGARQASIVSARTVESNAANRTTDSATKRRKSSVRNSFGRTLAHFKFVDPAEPSTPRLTGDPPLFSMNVKDESITDPGTNEVLLTINEAKESESKSSVASKQAVRSSKKMSISIPDHSNFVKKASILQPSDAYLALIGKSRNDCNSAQTSPSTPPSAAVSSPYSTLPDTPEVPDFPITSSVRDFAPALSPKVDQSPTMTIETRRGTFVFGPGSPGLPISPTQVTPATASSSSGFPRSPSIIHHPIVSNNRFSYGTVLDGKKDYALQNVEPFFTDPTGLYYKAFFMELKDLNSKTSEQALCIENFLVMSEKDWYNRLHKVKMGKRASTARPATIFFDPVQRAGSVVSIFNQNVESAAMPDNGAEQYLLKEEYVPPSGIKKLLLRRMRQWPLYAYLLAFVSWGIWQHRKLTANLYYRAKLLPPIPIR